MLRHYASYWKWLQKRERKKEINVSGISGVNNVFYVNQTERKKRKMKIVEI